MRRTLSVVLVGSLLALAALPAHAIFVGEGVAVPGGSWRLDLAWRNDGGATMDFLRCDIVPGSSSQLFKSPWFSMSGWTQTHADPHQILTTGTLGLGVTRNWSLHFAGEIAQPFYMIMTTYAGGVWTESALLTNQSTFDTDLFDTSGMINFTGVYHYKSLTQSDWDPGTGARTVVPEPSVLAIVGLTLAGVGLRRWRRTT